MIVYVVLFCTDVFCLQTQKSPNKKLHNLAWDSVFHIFVMNLYGFSLKSVCAGTTEQLWYGGGAPLVTWYLGGGTQDTFSYKLCSAVPDADTFRHIWYVGLVRGRDDV